MLTKFENKNLWQIKENKATNNILAVQGWTANKVNQSHSNDSNLLFSKHLRQHAEKQLLGGNYQGFLKSFEIISQSIIKEFPIILVYKAAAMLFSEFPSQEIEQVLQEAEILDYKNDLVGEITAIRAVIASYTHDPEEGIVLSQKALAFLDGNDSFFNNIIERNLGVAYTINSDLTNANKWFEKLLMSSYKLEDWASVLASYNYLTYLRKIQGRLSDAGVIYRKALSVIEEKRLEHLPHSIKLFAGYGHLLIQWHRLTEAKASLERAVSLAKNTDLLYAHTAYQHLIEVFIKENDIKSAVVTLQELKNLSANRDEFYKQIHLENTNAIEARINLEIGQIDQVNAWLLSAGFDKLSPAKLNKRFGYELGMYLPIITRAYIMNGHHEAAIRLLNALIPNFLTQNAGSYFIRSLCGLAIAYYYKGDVPKALINLKKALNLTESENNYGDIVIFGHHIVPVLFELMSKGYTSDFSKKISEILFLDKNLRKSYLKIRCKDSLSEREMDVLELIANGMSNKEIASTLFLSTNTIKSHSIKIYRKLNVNNRHQAVSRARLLGLIRPRSFYDVMPLSSLHP